MNENELLEMGLELKKKYELLEKKEKDIKDELLELKKVILASYGSLRVFDDVLVYDSDVPLELQNAISTLRSFLSDIVESLLT